VDIERVYHHFYRVPRLAASELSDGGGPFGFDVTTALEVEYLISKYKCDGFIETGCNMGDTTAYLAVQYPRLPIVTCDIEPRYVEMAKRRTAPYANVAVHAADSRAVLAEVRGRFQRPFYYLDAHWHDDWPLAGELSLIDRGVVMIDDFDIGHPRFGFDEYGGQRCGPEVLKPFATRIPRYYTNNPDGRYELPCLQVGRRGGKGYFTLGLEGDHLATRPQYFVARDNR
jgi:hypothetical protein